jgi:phenylacetate-coenzyme A ligase PaaK-like adenylate-forming protein
MAFLDIVPGKSLGAIVELAVIETGSAAARERWQRAQLRNLLTHATQRSSFWRGRIGAKQSDRKLGALPILTRTEVKEQVRQEGSLLLPTDGLQTLKHNTSGSSGIPVEFHASQMNVQYNIIRYLAQEFMYGRDLSVNRTRFMTAGAGAAEKLAKAPGGFTVEKMSSWLGDIGSVFASGNLKVVRCLTPDTRELVRELRKDAVGQLIIAPGLLGSIINRSGPKLLRELRVTELLPFGEAMDPGLHQAILDQGIPVRFSYTCEEAGPIGFECEAAPGHYHVASSNVIVEIEGSYEIEGRKLGRVLVTHLHSYATPFIRYDLGDLALLAERCPCGHAGPTIHSLYGRVTNALKHRDGTFSRFYIRGYEIAGLAECTEFRIRQVGFDSIVVEIGGRETLTPEEITNVTAFLQARAGDKFKIDVIARPAINWGDSIKRQSFRCEV